jgi:LysM repeat protein
VSGWVQGDVNCSGGGTPVNAVDALLILRANAGLSTNIPQGCPEIKPSIFYYTVQPGDTLAGIADQFGTTVDAIAALNGINPDDPLIPGTVLAIPGSPL